MDIIFSTDHAFLEDHFYPVRKSLRGEVVVFDASRPNSADAPLANAPSLALAEQRLDLVQTESSALVQPSKLEDRVRLSSEAFAAAAALKQVKRVRYAKPMRFKLANLALSLVLVVCLVAASTLVIPSVYYALFPADVIEVTAPENGTAFGGSFEKEQSAEVQPEAQPEEPKYVPPQDMTLPDGDWLVIPRIGVRSVLQPTADPEDALNTGLWWVPDFGKAGDTQLPMIVAAHRYGWQWWWKTDYWRYHSFYKLPETQPGDRIEVISDHRKWIYEIYAGEEGEEITDYDADLILYTCKFLKSPIRHFRYARLIDPTKDTQVGAIE